MTQHRADLSDSGRQIPRIRRGGRRIADRAFDADTTSSTYVGRRVAVSSVEPEIVPVIRFEPALRPSISERTTELAARAEEQAAVEPAPVVAEPVTVDRVESITADQADTAPALTDSAVHRAIIRLEPTDRTTSFAHDETEDLPMVRAGGKRRAVRRRRNPLLRILPSPTVGLGLAAMALAVAGTISTDDLDLAAGTGGPPVASALTGSSGFGTVGGRDGTVSRDSAADARADAAGTPLAEAASALAQERAGALQNLAERAQTQAELIEANQWVKPLESYRISAHFGATGLWSSHSGLDLAAPTGTPIYAVAGGLVTATGYMGNCGYTTVLTLENGTELRFCHQSEIAVASGTEVLAGDLIGYVGSTGRSTGPHLHLEVRPGGGDPVDPYDALQANGVEL